MPIRNEAAYIKRSLGAVLAQDYPPDRMEVLVVDGMSDDGTREIVRRMIEGRGQQAEDRRRKVEDGNAKFEEVDSPSSVFGPPPSVFLLDNPKGIVPSALNIGLRHAQGDVIIRVDGHCEIPPNYVQQCVKLLEQTGADNVGGIQWAIGENAWGEAVALATSSPFGVGNARFRYSTRSGWVDTVYLGAYRRDVFDRIGGFDEELVRNQDDEFNFRLLQAGGRIWLDPSLKVKYYSRSSWRKFWRQYFQYGLYKVRVIQKRGGVPSWRHLVPSLFVLGLLGSFVLTFVTGQPLWALVVAGPYAIANLGASLWAARRDFKVFPLLPLAFATLHLAYGLGFLRGLWKWRDGWSGERDVMQQSVPTLFGDDG